MTEAREFDIVIYGASGFTGKQATLYFAAQVPQNKVRWALAGRSQSKLEALRQSLGEAFAELPILIADSQDAQALRELGARTRVVMTTAGPFARYGELLVKACIETGTDYLDITGETPWIRHLIDTYHARAERKGVRIVNCCGVDSIPSDLTTYHLVRQTKELYGEEMSSVQGLFSFRGAGLNGGTLASMLNLAESGQLDQLSRPYLLNPGEEQIWSRPLDQAGIRWDPEWWVWTSPFFMAPVNTRIVRRSEALYRLAGQAYGPQFIYQEAMWSDEVIPSKSLAVSGVTLAMSELVRLPVFTRLLSQFGPKPGEGPSEEVMNQSSMSVWFRGKTTSGRKVKGHFFCKGDPGNKVTVKLLSESALALVENREELPQVMAGGILTPAVALGDILVKRLQRAGVTLDFRA